MIKRDIVKSPFIVLNTADVTNSKEIILNINAIASIKPLSNYALENSSIRTIDNDLHQVRESPTDVHVMIINYYKQEG